MSLPRLMRCLGTACSVADMYYYWKTLNILATRWPRSSGKEARREAAFERVRETGRCGHRDLQLTAFGVTRGMRRVRSADIVRSTIYHHDWHVGHKNRI